MTSSLDKPTSLRLESHSSPSPLTPTRRFSSVLDLSTLILVSTIPSIGIHRSRSRDSSVFFSNSILKKGKENGEKFSRRNLSPSRFERKRRKIGFFDRSVIIWLVGSRKESTVGRGGNNARSISARSLAVEGARASLRHAKLMTVYRQIGERFERVVNRPSCYRPLRVIKFPAVFTGQSPFQLSAATLASCPTLRESSSRRDPGN